MRMSNIFRRSGYAPGLCLLVAGCSILSPWGRENPTPIHAANAKPGAAEVPSWATDACWYQVFVSRFANGDPANDPPHTWPWTTDWLRQPPEQPPERTELFFRRYGGDLRGLQQRLGYLRELGVNTLYLSPVFSATSQHKYGTCDYRHIDDTYGVSGAAGRVQGETLDPASWKFTGSDRVFLDFLADAHREGMRVVIDGAFNHVGVDFWAFRDVRENGRASPYAAWFDLIDFGPPVQWNGWDHPNGELVLFARTKDGLHPQVEQHLFAITRRWLDPDGDGDTSDGVDGWRLDAADQVPHGFWQRWRKVVKETNPNALILGEIWADPSPWLETNEFDVVSSYPVAQAVMRFCRPGKEASTATEFAAELRSLAQRFDWDHTLALVNLLGSHDTDRLVSMCANPGRSYDQANDPGEGAIPYHAGKPEAEAYARARLAACVQFTFPGAPLVYYGDEVGMYGADDPYCRAPMWWEDLPGVREAGYRANLRRYYQELAALRRSLTPLRRGGFRVLLADDRRRVVAYTRRWHEEQVAVVLNGGTQPARVTLNLGSAGQAVSVLTPGVGEPPDYHCEHGEDRLGPGGTLTLTCPPHGTCLVHTRNQFSLDLQE